MGTGYHGGFGNTKGAEENKKAASNALPNAEKCFISDDKLNGYALNPTHDSGKYKARVFKSALGYDQTNSNSLKAQIHQNVSHYPAKIGKTDEYGKRYSVDIPISGPNGNTKIVRTAWIIKTGENIPRLTSIYVKED